MRMHGVYLPLVTPFYHGAVDLDSLCTLVRHYRAAGVAGLILLGTTGESPTVEPAEERAIVDLVLAEADGLPAYVGVSGNATKHVAEGIRGWESTGVAGYLVATPYYNRPGQDGLIAHYQAVAAETERTIIVYNVPYRTGVNLANDALFELVASTSTIRAVKDSGANIGQSLDLLHRAPADLDVLTGEDHLYFTALANGAAGGILASAHLATATFVEVTRALRDQQLDRGRELWRSVAPMMPLLFGESNPMPVKYCLWRLGLIRSPECRLPLSSVSAATAGQLDDLVAALPPS